MRVVSVVLPESRLLHTVYKVILNGAKLDL